MRTPSPLYVACLAIMAITAVHSYTVLNNPDAGDFSVFPLVSLAGSFPTTMAFSADGRIFVGQKNGVVRVVDANGKLSPTWIDLSDRVNSNGDKGMTSIVLHPEFPRVPYLYAIYPLWQPGDRDLNRVTQGIVARYTEVNGVGSVSSETILVGKVNGTGFPSCHNSHVTGDLVFGNDGTLFASAGEGSHWDAVDDGTNFNFDPYDWQCAPFFGSQEQQGVDVGSFRAQHLDNLGGKVIRFDPITGQGIGSNHPELVANPFFDAKNPTSPASLTWSYGHRNPWKLRLRADSPAPGTLFVAEVGAKDYEEINVVTAAGKGSNYGWPCQIANQRKQPWFTNAPTPTEYFVPRYDTAQRTVDMCTALQPSLTNTVAPILYYSRSQYVYGEYIGIIGNCASGLAFYNGTNYPKSYRIQPDGSRSLFISDFGMQWIKVIRVDSNNKFIESSGVQDFLSNVGTILHIAPSPVDGDLYYITEEGEINRIRYTAGYVGAPIVEASSNVAFVDATNSPAAVQFSSDGTWDPAGLALTFLWNFGDGTNSTQPNPSHTFTAAGKLTVTLTVRNSGGYSASQALTVVTNNNPPVAKINNPKWFQFNSGQNVQVQATFSDDKTPADKLLWQWEYRLIHNNHYHPNQKNVPQGALGAGASSVDNRDLTGMLSIYERNSWAIILTVYDTDGAFSRSSVQAVPNFPGNANYGNTPPVAAFTGTQKGSVVYFDGSVSSDADTDLLSYEWNWGDGSTGSGMVTYHTYTTQGTYTVTLKVTDPWNTSSSKTSQVNYKALGATGSDNAGGSGSGSGNAQTSSKQQDGSSTSPINNDPAAGTTAPDVTGNRGQKGSASTMALCVAVPVLAVLLL